MNYETMVSWAQTCEHPPLLLHEEESQYENTLWPFYTSGCFFCHLFASLCGCYVFVVICLFFVLTQRSFFFPFICFNFPSHCDISCLFLVVGVGCLVTFCGCLECLSSFYCCVAPGHLFFHFSGFVFSSVNLFRIPCLRAQ